MIKELAEQLSHGNNLTIDQMTNVMDEILAGTQNDEDVAVFLKNLTEKGESDDELLAMLNYFLFLILCLFYCFFVVSCYLCFCLDIQLGCIHCDEYVCYVL